MNDTKRIAIWEAYTDADSKHRYFLLLKDHLNRRILWISMAIAFFASGSVLQLALDLNLKYLPGGLALVASALGIYLASSNISKQVGTASAPSEAGARSKSEILLHSKA